MTTRRHEIFETINRLPASAWLVEAGCHITDDMFPRPGGIIQLQKNERLEIIQMKIIECSGCGAPDQTGRMY